MGNSSKANEKHHYIAQSALKRFGDKAGRISVFRVASSKLAKMRPSEVAYEKGFNTVDPKTYKQMFAEDVDPGFFEEILSEEEGWTRSVLEVANLLSLESLKLIVAIQEARLPRNRNYLVQSALLELAFQKAPLDINVVKNLSVNLTRNLVSKIFHAIKSIEVISVDGPLLLSDNPIVGVGFANNAQLGLSSETLWGFLPIDSSTVIAFGVNSSIPRNKLNAQLLNRLSVQTSAQMLFWDSQYDNTFLRIAKNGYMNISSSIQMFSFGNQKTDDMIIWAPYNSRLWIPNVELYANLSVKIGVTKMLMLIDIMLQLRRSDLLIKEILTESRSDLQCVHDLSKAILDNYYSNRY